VFVARLVRYGGEGLLALKYGDQAAGFLQVHAKEAGLWLSGTVLLGGLAWIAWRRRSAPAR